jgi:hypothetical protein
LVIIGTVWHVKGRILGSACMETEKDQEGIGSILITGLQSFEITEHKRVAVTTPYIHTYVYKI